MAKDPAAPPSPPTSVPLAVRQRKTREQHASETAQDYAEAIAELIEKCGEARATDVAREMGVSHVTVIRTVERLQRQGLVTTLPYRSIFLTDDGRKLAQQSRTRHEVVVSFLEALGVSPETAQSDAEGIEHHTSAETLAAMKLFLTKKA
jgi:DtxR family manganese transport transcriptional regulator